MHVVRKQNKPIRLRSDALLNRFIIYRLKIIVLKQNVRQYLAMHTNIAVYQTASFQTRRDLNRSNDFLIIY